MTRSDLIERIANQFTNLQLKDVELGIKLILDAMSNVLAEGGSVVIRDFGSFALNYRPPRKGRNPKTGEAVMVPAKYVPHFSTGRGLRTRVNEGHSN